MVCIPGQLLYGGRYKVERQIGSGGMGIAYLATNRQGKLVVLKTLRELILKSSSAKKFTDRFKDEALRLSLCRHPNIVSIENAFSESLKLGTEEIEVPFLAMEFIEGENLEEIVKREGKLEERVCLQYIQQIGEALEIVHDKGLLHRDIKPSNIMVRQGEAILIDFGLARGFGADMPQALTVAFTPGFAPPEQYREKVNLGEFVDVYALAGTLYYVLTATLPTNAIDRTMHVPLTSVRQLNPRVSERTSSAVFRGMALAPADRPQTVREWLQLLPDSDSLTPEVSPPSLIVSPTNSVLDISKNLPSNPTKAVLNAAKPDLADSIEALDYALARKKWEDADRITSLLLCRGVKQGDFLSVNDIKRLPSHLLFTIDRLWTKYSQGQFGYRIQRQVWLNLNLHWGTIEYEEAQKFGESVGWHRSNQWLELNKLNFSPTAPKAHLPSWRAGGKVVSWVGGRLGYFLSRWQ